MTCIRQWLVLSAMTSFLWSCTADLPNVILIMADDMGAECLSVYGGTSYSTPNLDQMAEEGLLVSHCIAQPLCTPSRVKLMTGRYNYRNYTHFGHLDTSWLNMGSVMKDAGYRTCISGKWQLNGLSYKEQFPDWDDPTRPYQMGFESYCLWQLTHERSEGERYSNPLIEQDGKLIETGPDNYGPDIFCTYILNYIDQHRKEPFFVYYPMVLVHEPFVPTPDSRDWIQADQRYRADTTLFADMVTYADKIVGRIRNRLEEHGIDKNTILIFTSDNGTHPSITSRTHIREVRGGKGKTISDGVHVPLLISWPDQIEKGRRFQGLIEFSDFFATLADLTDRQVETDGISFLPLLEGQPFRGRESAQVYYDPRWSNGVNLHRNHFVQTTEYKLYQNGSFYNLEHDVMERHPMATCELNSKQKSIFDKLHKELLADPGSLLPQE